MIFFSNYSQHQKPKVAFGVITYNRCDALTRCVESICSNISAPFDLVIADDGSNDLTRETCRQRGLPIIGKENRGIAWNKNRALYSLMSFSLADYIFLIEDDCLLTKPDFLDTWLTALDLFGHINLVHPSTQQALCKTLHPKEILGGTGRGDDPYACIKISGTLIASTRDAINRIGYFDTRFSGYGHEHAEWTTRFRRAGYGIIRASSNGQPIKANSMLSDGATHQSVQSASCKKAVHSNKEVYDSIKKESLYRHPWRSQKEKSFLEAEIQEAFGIYSLNLNSINDKIFRIAEKSRTTPESLLSQIIHNNIP